MLLPDAFLNFRLKNVYQGFAICEGVLYLTKNAVVIEYFTKDSFFGLIKSNLKTVRLDFSEILSAEVKKTFFSKKLIIKLKALNKIIHTPFESAKHSIFSESNAIEIPLKRGKDVILKARSIASFINEQIMENTLKNIENEL